MFVYDNDSDPIISRLVGNSNVERDSHLKNDLNGICLQDDSFKNSTLLRPQRANAESPIFVTLEGISSFSNNVQE
jgi:hypothetical protein